MSKKTENIGFICENCGKEVLPLTNGCYRNHCPFCLCSKHLDSVPGDRSSECHGLMLPMDIIYKPSKGYQIKHVCQKCGKVGFNMLAEDTVQPDNFDLVLEIMRKKSLEGI